MQLIQKLAGIGGERLNIFALSLGVNGIKRQRRFAAAAQAGDHHQLVTRNLQRQVLEVVLARPADFDECFAHNGQFCLVPKNQPTRAREKSKAGVKNSSRGRLHLPERGCAESQPQQWPNVQPLQIVPRVRCKPRAAAETAALRRGNRLKPELQTLTVLDCLTRPLQSPGVLREFAVWLDKA